MTDDELPDNELPDNELCPVGTKLWETLFESIYEENLYKKYVEHIMECKDCQEGLDIDETSVKILKEFWIFHDYKNEKQVSGLLFGEPGINHI